MPASRSLKRPIMTNRLNYFDTDLHAMSHLQRLLIAKWLSLCKRSLHRNGNMTGTHKISEDVKDQFQLAILTHCTDIRKWFFGGVWWAMTFVYCLASPLHLS